MASLFSMLRVASPALLVLLQTVLLLPAGAGAGWVTWERCKTGKDERVATSPLDLTATVLQVSECKLTEITQKDFKGLPYVTTVWLKFNGLTQLYPSTFRPLPKLNRLDLSHNKLQDLPVFDEDSLPQLTILELSDNLLTGIYDARTFSACVKLQKLFMQKNKIEYLHPEVFQPLHELTFLDISRNRITSLLATMFASNAELSVAFNKNNIAQLPANFASEVKKKGVQKINFFINNWQCKCLLEFMSDSKRVNLRYSNLEFFDINEYIRHGRHGVTATHFDGTRPECVFSGYVPAPQIKYKLLNKIHCTRE